MTHQFDFQQIKAVITDVSLVPRGKFWDSSLKYYTFIQHIIHNHPVISYLILYNMWILMSNEMCVIK
jgi:hypothetical protein